MYIWYLVAVDHLIFEDFCVPEVIIDMICKKTNVLQKTTIIECFYNRSCARMRVDLTSEFSLFGSESHFLNLNAHQWTTHRFYVMTCNSQIYFAIMRKWIQWTQVIFFHKICSHTVQVKILANHPEMKPKAWQKLCDSDLTGSFYSCLWQCMNLAVEKVKAVQLVDF